MSIDNTYNCLSNYNGYFKKPPTVSINFIRYPSVIEIYKLLCNLVTGDFVEPKYEINSEYEIQDQKLDARKIKNDLGIEASVSISEGLSKTFTWYKENVQYYG